MRTSAILLGMLLAMQAAAAEPIPILSPGFPPSQMDAEGRLVEDWAALSVKLSGQGIADGPAKVQAIQLDGVIPAAQCTSERGAVRLRCTAYRAPLFPEGVDVYSVRIEESKGQPAALTVSLDMPKDARIGLRTVQLGTRTVLTLSSEASLAREVRDWGSYDDATSLRGWAKPEGKFDPAFANIRAGMGGVPIVYRFAVKPGSAAHVILGFCESHWTESRQRPMVCQVEGAPRQSVDAVATWGQHKPGGLAFKARDANGDGKLEIQVRPAPGARDRNPILNAIWLFPPDQSPGIPGVIAGKHNDKAVRYVDCGGDNDQSIYASEKLEYQITLPAGGAKELTFLAAHNGSSSPNPSVFDWSTDAVRRAAADVWRDWPKQ